MATDRSRPRFRGWLEDRALLLDVFILSNVAFLILDVAVAHAINAFAHPAEWIPLVFAALATPALAVGLLGRLRGRHGLWRWPGEVVGWLGILVGIAGLIWHLEGQFFQVITLRRLIYSAPFVAPLAFAGLGLLLLMNRRVPDARIEWSTWVLFLAWGGFIGNFALSLADHAQNGFFYATEWIAVVVSAMAVGYFFALLVTTPQPRFFRIGYAVIGLQALTGLLGFGFHIAPLFEESAVPFAERVIFGAPVFAPLLFVDLAVLAVLGLWDLQVKMRATDLVEA